MNAPKNNKERWEEHIARQLRNRKNSNAVRWYVLTLPVSAKGLHWGNPAKELQSEVERRRRYGEPVFEYFAPSYVEVCKRKGSFVDTKRPLLYNYVFIHASENEIYRMKRYLPRYNFLPRVRSTDETYYPYLSDEEMANLKWVAESYCNVLPLYTPKTGRLMKGDRVRITAGKFAGVEACVVIQPGAGRKDVVVCVENCMYVPLLSVEPGQYEVIALNPDNRHLYSRLNSDRLSTGLHEALRRLHGKAGVTDKDRELASETLRQFGGLQMESNAMRCKLCSLLLPAYAILGNRKEYGDLLGTIQGMLPLIKAEQIRAMLLVTLYGCTNSSLYYEMAHAATDPWRKEHNPKKHKANLLRRLDDYDRWLGHRH